MRVPAELIDIIKSYTQYTRYTPIIYTSSSDDSSDDSSDEYYEYTRKKYNRYIRNYVNNHNQLIEKNCFDCSQRISSINFCMYCRGYFDKWFDDDICSLCGCIDDG